MRSITADQQSRLQRDQLTDAARGLPQRAGASPRGGWVRAMRQALGMSQAELAARAGVSRATVQKLEQAEANRRITLVSLDRLAAALGCQVAIALMPEGGSLDALRLRAAHAKAEELMKPTEHSMKLEGQGVSSASRQRVKRDLVESLLSGSSRKLWK